MNDKDRLLNALLDAVGDRIDAEVSAQNKTNRDRVSELESAWKTARPDASLEFRAG